MSSESPPASMPVAAWQPFWRRFLPRGSFMRRLVLLTSSTAAGQILLVLVSPLLTRLYSPTDFGFFASFATILGILGMVACLRYDLAVPLCRGEEEGTRALAVAILSTVLVSTVTALFVLLLAADLAALLGLPGSGTLLWWLPAGLFFVGLVTALNAWAMQRQALRELAWSKVTLATGQAAAQTGLGVAMGGPAGIVSGYLLGYAASAWTLLHRNRDVLGLLVRSLKEPRSLVALARRHARFPLYSSWGALLNASNRLLPALLLALLYGPQIAGLYALAQRVVGIPIRFIAVAASQVFISESARADRDDPESLHGMFVQVTLRLGLIGLVYLGGVAFAGPWLFALVFGAEWAPSGDLVRLLSPMYLAMFVKIPIEYTLNIFGRQDLALLIDLLGGAVVFASFGSTLFFDLAPETVVAFFSVGMTAAFALHFIAAYRLLRFHRLQKGGEV